MGLEQKKNYDLEQTRFKKLEEESKFCKERPLLSHKTEEMCKTLYKKPIYERAKEIIKNREKKLMILKKDEYNINKKLRNKKNNKKGNNSMDKINQNEEKKIKRKEYIINEKTKNRKMNTSEMKDYYNKQNEWKKRLVEKTKLKVKNQKKGKKGIQPQPEEESSFHPHICQGTIEIINAKNEVNVMNNPYQRTDYNNYYQNNDKNQNRIHLGKTVYDRLYEENALNEMKKQEYLNKSLCSFQPFTNKNKYRQIQSKYNEIDNKIKRGKNKNKNKNVHRGNKSVEIISKNEINEINDKNKLKSKQDIVNEMKAISKDINEPWTNTLLKLKKNKNNSFDFSYRLNIRQASAWNENDVNIIPLKGDSREIVKYFI